jgi:hypothetical protein
METLSTDIIKYYLIPALIKDNNMAGFGYTCKKHYKLSNEVFWKTRAEQLGLTVLDPLISVKDQVKIYLAINKPNKSLHAYIARLIGPVSFNAIPVLDLGDNIGRTAYLDFISTENMTAPVMRGEDRVKRPFICLRYKNNIRDKIRVITIFHRCTDSESWVNGTSYHKSCFRDRIMKNVYKDYMARLIKRESCGILKYEDDHDDEIDLVKTLDNGTSIIELV